MGEAVQVVFGQICRALFLVLLIALAGCGTEQGGSTGATEITVFAAASMTDALQAAADSFEVAHPAYSVALNVAASSVLARQIDEGARADLYVSANVQWMDSLQARERIRGTVTYPLSNTLVVVGEANDPPPVNTPSDLTRLPRIALADPEHVPAGLYAKQALRCEGLWDDVRSAVVPMMDVRTAVLSVRNGAAPVAIAYGSDALVDPGTQVLVRWPAACEPDIRYAMGIPTRARHPDAARRLLHFLVDSTRNTLWKRYGFTPVRDTTPAFSRVGSKGPPLSEDGFAPSWVSKSRGTRHEDS